MAFYASLPTNADSKFSKHLASFKSTLSSFRTQRTAFSSFSGLNFSALAQETKRKINTNGVQWKWLENMRHFAVYTKPSSSAFGVLSVGTIKASVQEVASLLASGSHVEYEQKMAALHGSEFKHGAYVADVPNEPASAEFADEDTGEVTIQLSYDAEKPRFEKLLTTLTPVDVVGSPLEDGMKRSDANRFRGITAGYSVQPEETLQNMQMKREDSFCQHTIMSDKPLIVPNPEADVRFNRIMPVTEMGIRYYCGFPITSGKDITVIATLCCADQKKHELTETQFSAMQKLAQMASKVVKIQGERRRNSSAASSRY